MNQRKTRYTAAFAGFAVALLSGMPALADDSEIYLDAVSALQKVKPNVLLLMDTSISMQAELTEDKGDWDPTRVYPNLGGSSGCYDNRVYWIDVTSGDPTPAAGWPNCLTGSRTGQWFYATANKCKAAIDTLATDGTWYDTDDKMAHWRGNTTKQWRDIRTTNDSPRDAPVECQSDFGTHGFDAASTNRYIRENSACTSNQTAGCYTNSNAGYNQWGSRKKYRLFSGRYLNWYYATSIPTGKTRMEVAIEAAQRMVNSSTNMRIGMMAMRRNGSGTIDQDGEGGSVLQAIADVQTNKSDILTAIGNLQDDTYTTSAEMFYEATNYFRGGPVDYGRVAPRPSVAASRTGDTYISPIQYKCQRNYLIFVSDGVPRGDRSVETAARVGSLPNWAAATANGAANSGTNWCAGNVNGPSGFGAPDGGGRCLDDIAAYLANADLRTDLDDKQNVITYTVGFSEEVAGETFLKDVADAAKDRDAKAGDPEGMFYQANTSVQLNEVFKAIRLDVEKQNVTFTSPTVSVDAFNRTQSGKRAFVSVFQTDTTDRWYGNLKKYQIDGGKLKDVTGKDAVNNEGFFAEGTRSYWSDLEDADQAVLGGAAGELRHAAGVRKVYTNVSTGDLTATGNSFDSGNASITDALLDTNTTDEPFRSTLIDWARGMDVQDEDGDGNRTESRMRMGDPMHTRPVTVTYSKLDDPPEIEQSESDPFEDGQSDDPSDRGTIVFTATNEGLLQAVDAETGKELWSFMPKELWGRLKRLYNNAPTTQHDYGIDGDITVLKYDADGEGGVGGDADDGVDPNSANDRVILFFGLRRGGSYYYALDVTDIEEPTLLWVNGKDQMIGLGDAWSTPQIARIMVGTPPTDPPTTAIEDQHLSLIIGGGYSETQETPAYSKDTEGNALFILDALTGAVQWRAGTDSGADLRLTSGSNLMENSIPADVSVIDLDGDFFADRLYVGDMGGQLWRFDISNGKSASELVAGGIIARLGAAGVTGATMTDTRRFYNRPDVSLVTNRGARPYLNIAIGSGYRGHPLNKETQERFFSVRDWNALVTFDQATYNSNAATPIVSSDLTNVTGSETATVAADAKGWFLDLIAYGTGTGEKVLSESTTIEGTVQFTTYTPPTTTVQACDQDQFGKARVYQVRSEDGAALFDDRSSEIDVAGIPPGVTVLGGDEAPGVTIGDGDLDNDDIPDAEDPDDDNDGIPDIIDDDVDNSHAQDTDGDGTPDYADGDDDNDNIPDTLDTDDDNDGILDIDEEIPPPPPPGGPLPTCWVGPQKLEQCVKPGTKVRTYWFKQAG